MGNKGNVVLYLDKEIVEKSKALGLILEKRENEKAETKYGSLYFCFSVCRVSRGE